MFCDIVKLGRFWFRRLKCTKGGLPLKQSQCFINLCGSSAFTPTFPPANPLLNSTFYFKQAQIRDNDCFPRRVPPALCRCASLLPNWTCRDWFPRPLLCADRSMGAFVGKCRSHVWPELRLNGPLSPGGPLFVVLFRGSPPPQWMLKSSISRSGARCLTESSASS